MLLDIEFEDGDCIGITTLFEEHVTEPIERAFGEIIILGIRALEFAVLGDRGVCATSHYSHAEVMDERSFRLGRLLAIKDGANPLGHFAQVRPRSVVEDDDEVSPALKTIPADPSAAVHRNLCTACKRNGARNFGAGLDGNGLSGGRCSSEN